MKGFPGSMPAGESLWHGAGESFKASKLQSFKASKLQSFKASKLQSFPGKSFMEAQLGVSPKVSEEQVAPVIFF
jgi:hypothetical protein